MRYSRPGASGSREPSVASAAARRLEAVDISETVRDPRGVPPVSISLLGGFAAVVDGAPLPSNAWRLRKARELVKLLALADGHRLHREQAMDALWGDRGLAAAANNLN